MWDSFSNVLILYFIIIFIISNFSFVAGENPIKEHNVFPITVHVILKGWLVFLCSI